MRLRHHESSRAVFIVSTGRGVEELFTRRDDAERYASDTAGATISTHVIRDSIDDATVIFDRRVVISAGIVRSDCTMLIRQYIDDPILMPARADVEWFQGDRDDEWHIAGFGTDEADLTVKVADAVQRAVGLSARSVAIAQ